MYLRVQIPSPLIPVKWIEAYKLNKRFIYVYSKSAYEFVSSTSLYRLQKIDRFNTFMLNYTRTYCSFLYTIWDVYAMLLIKYWRKKSTYRTIRFGYLSSWNDNYILLILEHFVNKERTQVVWTRPENKWRQNSKKNYEAKVNDKGRNTS